MTTSHNPEFTRQELRALRKLTLPILATQLAQIGMGTIQKINPYKTIR
ncbi:hypothetical protein [Bacterioplanoides sp. SCSIO 12839]|nr:hypothetical protein [Bacterioplanoides sp. SCSIO 12839]UTW49830.1 hypothetical protein KFF03_08110 [Bacterioplanoides sp. SCSIO 12839]